MFGVSMMILVLQNDLGSSLLFFGLFLAMLYVATERPGWLVVGGLLFGAGALAAYTFVGNVQNRFNFWLHPMDYYDASPGSYQLGRGAVRAWAGAGSSAAASATASPSGSPFAESDFILAAIGEELGLTAVMAVILCYGLIVERALRIALISRDGFGKLLAVGLGVDRRAPGLRRHRRRHRPDPADRPDHPVPVVRRLVAGRQLGRSSRCCCASPTRPAAPPRASTRSTTPAPSDSETTQVVKLR